MEDLNVGSSPASLFIYLRTECPLIFNRCNIKADDVEVLMQNISVAQVGGGRSFTETGLLLFFQFLERIVEGSLIITKDIVEAFSDSGIDMEDIYYRFCDDDPFYEIVTEKEAMEIAGCKDKKEFHEKYDRLCTPFEKNGIGVHYLRQHIELLKEII